MLLEFFLIGVLFRCHRFSFLLVRITYLHTFSDSLALASKKVEEQEQIAGSLALIFVIVAFCLSSLHRHRHAGFGDHLIGHFIKTDPWALWIFWFGIQIQDLLHAPDEICLRILGILSVFPPSNLHHTLIPSIEIGKAVHECFGFLHDRAFEFISNSFFDYS